MFRSVYPWRNLCRRSLSIHPSLEGTSSKWEMLWRRKEMIRRKQEKQREHHHLASKQSESHRESRNAMPKMRPRNHEGALGKSKNMKMWKPPTAVTPAHQLPREPAQTSHPAPESLANGNTKPRELQRLWPIAHLRLHWMLHLHQMSQSLALCSLRSNRNLLLNLVMCWSPRLRLASHLVGEGSDQLLNPMFPERCCLRILRLEVWTHLPLRKWSRMKQQFQPSASEVRQQHQHRQTQNQSQKQRAGQQRIWKKRQPNLGNRSPLRKPCCLAPSSLWRSNPFWLNVMERMNVAIHTLRKCWLWLRILIQFSKSQSTGKGVQWGWRSLQSFCWRKTRRNPQRERNHYSKCPTLRNSLASTPIWPCCNCGSFPKLCILICTLQANQELQSNTCNSACVRYYIDYDHS